MKNRIKALFKRGKAVLAAAVIAVTSAMTAAVACAEDAVEGGSNMSAMLSDAGDQITTQFTDLVGTIVPVIIGIMGTGLVIFGIIALVKLAKKIFGKVAG
ncbi:MAG: hypothetical protein J6A16_04020 [Oscillospiraceae bacterium]|nr:hypothetical protein [Oscillospiraceae bacterium]